jgi:hypothetical protein
MDIKTLESLGISPETLGDRIVDQAVEVLLSTCGFDPDTEQETRYESRFKKAIEAKIQKAVDEKISALAAVHLVPRVGEMIETADMRKTNRYGEPVSAPMTFKEYIAHRAESYMTEDVDYHGNSKADLEARNESTYNWKSSGPRLSTLMKLYIMGDMERAAKAAVTDINSVIAANITKAAKDAIDSVAGNLTVSISAQKK